MQATLSNPPSTSTKLFDVQQVADLLNCSPRHVYRLADAGKMPRPLRLGSLVRWNSESLDEWIRAGCPSCREKR